MHIAILGAGNVGAGLAQNLLRLGESVFFGVPEPAKYQALAERLDARIGSVEQAIEGAQIVILAVPYLAALGIAECVSDWQDRVLVDATNPLAPALSGLVLGTTTSAGEQIAERAHNARVVKCFNVTGAENLANPHRLEGAVFMPVASDDASARGTLIALATRMGFDALDAGPLKVARYLEPFAMTWIHFAFAAGLGRSWALSRAHLKAVVTNGVA
jgi:8-hydroxy-5-deazaflavin:NADPH oxidoreductase